MSQTTRELMYLNELLATQDHPDIVIGMIDEAVAESAAMAMGSLYQSMSHSGGIMFENSVSNQNLQNMTTKAVTTQGVMQIYSVDTISDSITTARMLSAST